MLVCGLMMSNHDDDDDGGLNYVVSEGLKLVNNHRSTSRQDYEVSLQLQSSEQAYIVLSLISSEKDQKIKCRYVEERIICDYSIDFSCSSRPCSLFTYCS